MIFFPAVGLMVWLLYRSFQVLLIPLEQQKFQMVQLLERRILIALGIFMVLTRVFI